jgi:hypothetical protein
MQQARHLACRFSDRARLAGRLDEPRVKRLVLGAQRSGDLDAHSYLLRLVIVLYFMLCRPAAGSLMAVKPASNIASGTPVHGGQCKGGQQAGEPVRRG